MSKVQIANSTGFATSDIRQFDRRWAKRMGVGIWLTLWCFVVLGVLASMSLYEFGTAATGSKSFSPTWPAECSIAIEQDEPTLLVFVHPKCPCSQATVTELEQLLRKIESAEGTDSPQSIIIAVVPKDYDSSWLQTASIARALALPRAELFIDEGGVEAQRFGAEVSGTVLYYSSERALQYGGGVTAARGHAGPNVGRENLGDAIANRPPQYPAIPAFGCRLAMDRLAE